MHLDLNQAVDFLEEILGKKKISQYDISISQCKSLAFKLQNQTVTYQEVAFEQELCFRTIDQGRLGFGYTNTLYPEAIQQAVENAQWGCQWVRADSYRQIPKPSPHPYPNLHHFDANRNGLTEEIRVETLRQMEELACNTPQKNIRVESTELSEDQRVEIFRNSHGINLNHQETNFVIQQCLIAKNPADEEDEQSASNFQYSPFFHKLNPRGLVTKIQKRALDCLGARTLASGKYPILLENTVVADMLDTLAPSFSAEEIQQNSSHLCDKIGSPIFSPMVTLIDDATLPGQIGSYVFDAEGMPGQRTLLVERGIFQQPLYDSYTARKDKAQSTGNSMRNSLENIPIVSPSNFFLQPGSTSPSDLLQNLQNGLWIYDVIGLHTIDMVTGNFSLGAAGFWVEKGQRLFPVRDITLAGNLFHLFKNVQLIGSDLHFFGSTGAPSVLLPPMAVGGV